MSPLFVDVILNAVENPATGFMMQARTHRIRQKGPRLGAQCRPI